MLSGAHNVKGEYRRVCVLYAHTYTQHAQQQEQSKGAVNGRSRPMTSKRAADLLRSNELDAIVFREIFNAERLCFSFQKYGSFRDIAYGFSIEVLRRAEGMK